MLAPVLTVVLTLSQGICTTGSTRTCKITNCPGASQVCLPDRTWGPCVCSQCDDGNPCTTDTWSGTACVSTPADISDGNPCTSDACDPRTGITHTPVANGSSCSDGNVCNGAEYCSSGWCWAGTPLQTDDGNLCTIDSCDPVAGVSHVPVPAGTSCSDGNPCNGLELCNSDRFCVAGTPPVVSDGNPCTADSCDPLLGVVHTPVPVGTSCSDGNVCNGVEVCAAGGVCVAGAPLVEDDGDPCTADACDPITGVSHTFITGCPLLLLDPAAVAPPLDHSAPSSMADATAFLYSGPNRIQYGVAPGTIDPARVAVLRGVVLDVPGAPIAGAMITILGHPEFGHTYSRLDGAFDIAVNGGGPVIVQYWRDGYLPVLRQVVAPSTDFTWLPDVRLTAVDLAVTPIQPGAPDTQVAQGSVVADLDGTRQATLLFPPGITGALRMPDGSSVALTEMHVRATEFTVGSSGPSAMPADLPVTSAYTYAVELSLDEALMAGASSVEFGAPVPFYLDNFLGFPVGTTVPVGALDRGVGQWNPSDDGVVVKILDTSSGVALLDTNGDDVADDDALLASRGITTAERSKLAQLYSPGKTLWRMQTAHFSVFDLNWCWGCAQNPDGSPACSPPSPPVPPRPETPEPKPDCTGGSIIECQGQVLREAVSLTGTPFALWYSSREQTGNAPSRTIRIPMTGLTLPSGAMSVVLDVRVMGQQLREEYSPAPNLFREFTWDGKDAYGRPWQGTVDADVRIGFTYRPVYLGALTVAGQTRSFAAIAERGGGGQYSVVQGRAEPTFVSWTTFKVPVSHWDARGLGLGGWTISEHAVYDKAGRMLHKGNGTVASGTDIRVVEATAGGGQGGWVIAEGLWVPIQGYPANEAELPQVREMIVAPDGALLFLGAGYVSAGHQSYLWKLGRDGLLRTVAGGPHYGGCATGEDVPASTACVGFEGAADDGERAALAIGSDGSIYYSEYYGLCDSQVRRISPDGIVHTVFGTRAIGTVLPGTCLAPDEGVPANLAHFANIRAVAFGPDGAAYFLEVRDSYTWVPSRIWRVTQDGLLHKVAGFGSNPISCSNTSDAVGTTQFYNATDLAFGPDGNLYIDESTCHRIRRLTPDGILTTIAGGGPTSPNDGDGGKATNAVLRGPEKVAFARDGTLFILENGVCRIRMVSPEGIITTYAGKNTQTCPQSNAGAPAIGNTFYWSGTIAASPGGDVYVNEGYLRGIIRGLRWSGGADVIPSSDGTSYDLFDPAGRTTARVDAMTGVGRYEFQYGSGGTLSAIVDTSGRATTIERDSMGLPTAVVSPDGERTTLALDANGFLSLISNPAGESVNLTHSASGLLQTFRDPRGQGYEHSFLYDANGRLIRDQNPAGGYKSLTRTDNGDTYSTLISTLLGRNETYKVEALSTKDVRFTRTRSDGSTVVDVATPAGTRTSTRPDGTTVTTSTGPDPRFGMQSPVSTVVIRTPAGKSLAVAESRTATLTNRADFQSATSIGETISVNGRPYSATYDVASRTHTAITPGGRSAVSSRNAQGRVVEVRPPGYPSSSSTSLTYDAAGRISALTTGNRTVSITYGTRGYLETITDPLSRTVSFGYDPAGRVQTQVLPGSRTVTLGYDANGNLTSLAPPGRPVHGLGYSSIDLLTSYTPPAEEGTGLLSTSYSYDLDGALGQVLFPDQSTIDAGYDAAGRLSSVTSSRGMTSIGYDAASRVSTVQAPGGGSVTLAYDGFLKTSETWSGAVGGTVGWTYDNDFRFASTSVNGTAVSYAYDPDGLLTGAGALSIGREPATGRISSTSLGTVGTSFAYDNFGALDWHEATANGASLYSYTLYRDNAGRISGKAETIQGVTTTWSYDYDAAGRLSDVSANGQLVASYLYDANGNRLQKTTPSVVEDGAADDQDRLVAFGAATYAYTATGALAAKTVGGATTQYVYDGFGNLLTVALPSGASIEYLVDGLNRRVGKKVNGTRVEGFLYDGRLRPVAWLDGAGNVYARFVYGTRINIPEYMTTSAGTFRIITDHLGSPRLVLNTSTGAVAQRMDYDEWGNVVADTAPGFQPFGFAGGLYDRDTGLVRFGARDYDPGVGRWSNKDPVRFAGGLNLYAYVDDDPVNFTDPTGLLVEVYYEGIGGSDNGRWIAQLFDAQHAWVHVETPDLNMMIEMEGPQPGERYGHLRAEYFDPTRAQHSKRRGVTAPGQCGGDQFAFENDILDLFATLQGNPDLLPDYLNDPLHGNFNNSNTFASYLITTPGGSINNVPFTAYGSGAPFYRH